MEGFTEEEALWHFHPIAFVQHLKRLFTNTFPFERLSREVHSVFIHCSDSDVPAHDSWKVIDEWRKDKGWSGIGYHYFIKKDGTIEKGRKLEKIPAAHVGHNTGSVAICLHGKVAIKFTQAQFDSLISICEAIKNAYNDKKIKFRGHHEVEPLKTCPVFDYKKILNLDSNGHMK